MKETLMLTLFQTLGLQAPPTPLWFQYLFCYLGMGVALNATLSELLFPKRSTETRPTELLLMLFWPVFLSVWFVKLLVQFVGIIKLSFIRWMG